jgi:hypothetical protein
MKVEAGAQITKNGITITVDFVRNETVYFKKHKENASGSSSLDDTWRRFIGLYRMPLSDFEHAIS